MIRRQRVLTTNASAAGAPGIPSSAVPDGVCDEPWARRDQLRDESTARVARAR